MRDEQGKFPVDRRVVSEGIVPMPRPDQSNMVYLKDLGYYEETDSVGFDFWSMLRILLSRKWMILAIAIVGVTMAIASTLRETPLYMSTATIQIQSDDVQIIEGSSVGPDLVADSTYMETQFRLLRSRSLAERVVEDLGLLNDPRYAYQSSSRESRVLQAASRIVGGVRVSPAGRSRLVGVSFISPHQIEAARISNAIVEAFIQTNLERKYNTTAFAREFLDERLETTKQALEQSERRFVNYAEDQGLLDIGGSTTGAGSLDENSIIALNNELSQAESARILAEQEYRAALDTPPYSELLQSTPLTNLRQSRADLLTDYQEMLSRFKPDYPDMVRLQTRIDRLEEQIQAESDSIVQSVLNDLKANYETSLARESSLRERVGELRESLQDERNRRIQYRILQREVETIRSQYQGLLQRSKEISIASGIGSSNIAMVDAALVPGGPFEPNLRRSIIQALIMSLAVGIGLAFILNYIDDTIKTPEDLRNKMGLTTIGVVPKTTSKKDFVKDALDDPRSAISEAFASARTALEFSTENGVPKSLLVTSTRPGEGKTSTTIALASVFARGDNEVLVIDGDMRKPSFIIDSNKSIGLSGLLTGNEHLSSHVVRSNTPGLSILPAGVVPPNPAQLLSGPRLREIIETAEKYYDIVIVDSPPLLSFADSPRLGSVVEAAVVVVQAGLIRTPAAKRTVAQLYEARTNIVGGILTKFDAKRAGYDYQYYYSTTYGRDSYAYVETESSKDKRRKILIEAASNEGDENESEKWA